MSNFIITNIRLPEEDYLRLKGEAARQRKSLAAIIRKKISQKKSPEDYAKKLLTLKTDWFSYEDFKRNKAAVEKRMKQYRW